MNCHGISYRDFNKILLRCVYVFEFQLKYSCKNVHELVGAPRPPVSLFQPTTFQTNAEATLMRMLHVPFPLSRVMDAAAVIMPAATRISTFRHVLCTRAYRY
jgi:hypothetical protein